MLVVVLMELLFSFFSLCGKLSSPRMAPKKTHALFWRRGEEAERDILFPTIKYVYMFTVHFHVGSLFHFHDC